MSGGPAFFPVQSDAETYTSLWTIGIISAYMPNWATGQTLPGLAVAQDVSLVHEWAKNFRTLDQAKEAEPTPDELPATEPPA